MTNSRRKGKVFENTVCKLLRECGWQARRAQQYSGAQGTADIISDFPGHLECKHSAVPSYTAWWRQASKECGSKVPVVVFRINRHPIRVMVEGVWPCCLPERVRAAPDAYLGIRPLRNLSTLGAMVLDANWFFAQTAMDLYRASHL